VGWLPEHPLRIPCGKCGILISGVARFNSEKIEEKLEFQNAHHVAGEVSAFYIECSGELLTEKLRKRDSLQPGEDMLAPFIKAYMAMGQERYVEFKSRCIGFLTYCEKLWPSIRRVNELWLNESHHFLRKELRKKLPTGAYPLNNAWEEERGVHQANIHFTEPVRDPIEFNSTVEFLWKELPSLAGTHREPLKVLVNDFAQRGRLKDYHQRFLKVLERMVSRFRHVIPAYSVPFYNGDVKKLAESKGLTTAGFDDLKEFYIDCFEDAGEILLLLVAYNNLKHRSDHMSMRTLRKDISTLDQFHGLSKGNRVQFIDGKEDFDFLANGLNSQLRNAIGHSAYRFDSKTQLITYYPKGKLGVGDEKRMYLVEFAMDFWRLFNIHVCLNELVYQSDKIFYLASGVTPINSEKFHRAIRRAAKKKRQS